jgi:hypothetical protein
MMKWLFLEGILLGRNPTIQKKTNVCLTTFNYQGKLLEKDGLCTTELARLCSKNCIANGLTPKAKEALTQNKKQRSVLLVLYYCNYAAFDDLIKGSFRNILDFPERLVLVLESNPSLFRWSNIPWHIYLCNASANQVVWSLNGMGKITVHRKFQVWMKKSSPRLPRK